MHALGLTPVVTLYHFTLPRWAANIGGWTNPLLVSRFAALAAECARQFGDLVFLWCTINEPAVLVYNAYAGRAWPPGTGNLLHGLRALRHLLLAHAAAYRAIHEVQPVFVPPLAFPLQPAFQVQGSCDFVGLNYYGRYLVRFDVTATDDFFGRHVQQPTVRLGNTDWGQVYPEGLTRQLLRLRALGVPLYVTENGVCDNLDAVRPGHIVEHVRAVHRAIQRGADVRGYFHWSLVDNFEWVEGWSARFGLIAVNPFTQERRLRASAEVYAEICRTNSVEA